MYRTRIRMSLRPANYEDAKSRYKPMRRSPIVNKGSGLKRKSGMKRGKPIKATPGLSLKDRVWNQFSIYIRRRVMPSLNAGCSG
jgi:hypothetical protein